MDRRQKKTREAIFRAFTELLSDKHYNAITVGEIIDVADVGRATFYAHFETKDFLLKEFCEELFCHIFDAAEENENHRHIFHCDDTSSVILHLLHHLQKNDNNILELLSCENNELFLRYFKDSLKILIQREPSLFGNKRNNALPDDYWVNFVASTFVETVRWWIDGGMTTSPERISEYFTAVI